jgi:hypothetical protein
MKIALNLILNTHAFCMIVNGVKVIKGQEVAFLHQ